MPRTKGRKRARTGTHGATVKPIKGAGRRRVVGVGERLSRTQIAARAKIDRATVSKYLAMQGAPKPDAAQRYSYAAVMAWIEKQAPRVGSNTDEIRRIRESILRMEAEDMAIDLSVKRGQFVDKKSIEPVIASFMAALTDDLRAKFEGELPQKYEGKTAAERAKLNADGIDYVLGRLKSGARPLTSKP